MFRSSLERVRRWVSGGSLVFLGAWVVWTLLPGLPVLSGPRANAKVKEAGLVLFQIPAARIVRYRGWRIFWKERDATVKW